MTPSYDLETAYVPVALYFQEADFVEYVREDACCVFRRIDETLTLALEMDSRLPIGFRIKGFKNLYLKSSASEDHAPSFVELIEFIERVTSDAGNEVFSGRRIAYRLAADIARSDHVKLDTEAMAA